LQGQEKIWSL